MGKVATVILAIALLLAFSFICTAGLFWLVCFAFNLTFSWKYAIGVWAIIFLVSSAVKSTNSNK